MELGLLGAFAGGVLTILSPCSVMLLPAFFAYAFADPRTLMARTGIFYLGLVTTLVPLGLLAGTIGSWLTTDRDTVVTVAAVLLVALGVLVTLGVPLPWFSSSGGVQGTSTLSVYVLGTVYGFAGACTGPLLGAVLTMAALGGNALWGGIMLLVFGFGMTVPLVVLAVLWPRVPGIRALVRPREIVLGRWRNSWTMVVGGLVTVLAGVLLLRSEGTTAWSGVLGASDQFRLENTVREWTERVPDQLVVVLAAAVAGMVWWVRRKLATRAGSAQSSPSTAEPDPDGAPGPGPTS